jgi:hypothetical protein
MSTTGRIAIVTFIAFTALAPARIAFAQATQGDHWKHVPPLATTCFANDDFLDELDAATTAINAEIEKQDKMNAVAKEKFDNMDMMEKAQHMQAFMVKNPQAAMRMMQANESAGAAATSAVSEGNERVKRLTAALKRLQSDFETAMNAAVQPVTARQDEFIKARATFGGHEGAWFTNADAYAQYVKLIEQENAAIETACQPFFGANGSFHKWLASWRSEVTERNITAGVTTDLVVLQMEAMDLPGGGYRSTNPLQQVGLHVRTIGDVYAVRPRRAEPRLELKR